MATDFASADGRTDSQAASMAADTETLVRFNLTLPEAMRDTSSSSSIICDCTRALRSMTLTACMTRERSRSVRLRMEAQPRMALSGVRSS
jgi:hypothetical protein